MEKRKRVKYGLDSATASIVDIDTSSLFDIFVPKQLRSGKNEIRLRLINDGLVKGSEILIDILDQLGNPLYYEIGEVANEDKSRSIVVEIEPSDLTGPAKLYIYAKLSQTSSYLSIINLEINSELETEQEIKFVDPPEIYYREKKLATQTFTNQSRKVVKVGSGNVSTLSPIVPKQLVESTFQVEKKELRSVVSQGSTSNNIGSGSSLELPQQFSLAQITSEGFPFSSSYKGGEIVLNGISLEIPNDALNPSPFTNLSYSASILNVLSTGSIEVYPPFSRVVEYQSLTGIKKILVDKLIDHSNFTCSFNEVLTLSQTNYSQSYAVFDIYNLDPITGKVASIDVSYKNLSLIGDNYEPLGNFEVRSQNYLLDSDNITFDNERGIVETPVGVFKSGVSDFQNYWQTSSVVQVQTTNSIPNGIKFSGNDITFEPKSQYQITNRQNQNWNLEFDYELAPSQSLPPQIDIFVSGSDIKKISETKPPVLTPIPSPNLGTYIGSLTDRRGRAELSFNVNGNTRISPKFTLRRGFLSIGNIALRPEEKVGYNVKQTRIFAPLNIPTGSELNFKFDYVNPVGKRVNKFSSLLPGVYFEGSFKPTTGGGSVSIPPGTVSGSDQLTSSYDNRYERKGTGIISSSNQIATEISGAFVGPSSSFSARVTDLESKSGSYVGTGSYNQDSGSWNARFNIIEQTTGSLNSYTSSNNTRLNLIEQATASLNAFTSSANSRLSLLENRTGSYATTGSNTFRGNQIVSGTIEVTGSGKIIDSLTVGTLPNTGLKLEVRGNSAGILLDRTDDEPFMIFAQAATYVGQIRGISGGGLRVTGPLSSNEWMRFTSQGNAIFNISATGSFSGSFHGMISSSNQVKNLLPSGVASGSEQFTGSYDLRYERKGTGILSSSNQIANDISGSFVSSSNSLSGRINIFETKTLFSSSQQVDYNQITNKPTVSGSGLYRLMISSGSDSSSYGHKNLTYDTSQSKLLVTGSTNLNGNLYMTGSTSTRMSFIWDGPKVVSGVPGIEWTNMENQLNTWLGTGGTPTQMADYIGDFTEITQGRLFTYLSTVAGGVTCSLEVQYSTNGGVNWNSMVTLVVGNAPGYKDTGWSRIPTASAADCYIRLVGWGGDGLRDPKFSPPIAIFR